MRVDRDVNFFDPMPTVRIDKATVLVAYDIQDNKRRLKIAKLLESYGYRVQKSVFEMTIEKNKIRKLVNEIDRIVKQDDQVKAYLLKGVSTTYTWGRIKDIEEEDVIFI